MWKEKREKAKQEKEKIVKNIIVISDDEDEILITNPIPVSSNTEIPIVWPWPSIDSDDEPFASSSDEEGKEDNVDKDELEDEEIENRIKLCKIYEKELKKLSKFNDRINDEKIRISIKSLVTFDNSGYSIFLKEYLLCNNDEKDLFLTIYAEEIKNSQKADLENDVNVYEKYVFINCIEVLDLNQLKECTYEQQKAFYCLKEEIFSEEELSCYHKFRPCLNTEDREHEKVLYKKRLIDEYGDVGEALFQYFMVELKANALHFKYN